MTAPSKQPVQYILKSMFDDSGNNDKVIWWDYSAGKWRSERVGSIKTQLMSALINSFN